MCAILTSQTIVFIFHPYPSTAPPVLVQIVLIVKILLKLYKAAQSQINSQMQQDSKGQQRLSLRAKAFADTLAKLDM